MLRQVSNGAYLDAIRMAEKFILHVEVLFGTIDDLEFHFASLNMKGMPLTRQTTFSALMTSVYQECPISGKLECYVGKLLNCSRCSHILKRQEHAGWA